MKTTIHYYNFDISSSENLIAYENLCEKLRNTKGRGRWMNAIDIGTNEHRCNGATGQIDLDPKHLFSNQWNTVDGRRVFDWYEEAIFCNGHEIRHIKRGHYLDITEEMVAIRDNTYSCCWSHGYFPKDHEYVSTHGFNITRHAIGSEYLKVDELHLLRLFPISVDNRKPAPLTDAEREFLTPLYIKAQTEMSALRDEDERIKARNRVEGKIAEARLRADRIMQTAYDEPNGFQWLLDRDVNVSNCIFYNHTGVFEFGWQKPLSKEVAAELRRKIEGFPFKINIKEQP